MSMLQRCRRCSPSSSARRVVLEGVLGTGHAGPAAVLPGETVEVSATCSLDVLHARLPPPGSAHLAVGDDDVKRSDAGSCGTVRLGSLVAAGWLGAGGRHRGRGRRGAGRRHQDGHFLPRRHCTEGRRSASVCSSPNAFVVIDDDEGHGRLGQAAAHGRSAVGLEQDPVGSHPVGSPRSGTRRRPPDARPDRRRR